MAEDNKKKKILIIAHSSSATGGGESDLIRLLSALKNNYEISLIVPEGPKVSEYKKYVTDILNTYALIFPFTRSTIKDYLRYFYKFRKLNYKKINDFVAQEKFDLCYIHSTSSLLEFKLAKKHRIPIVITAREIFTNEFIRNFIYSYYLKNATTIVCISEYVKSFFRKPEYENKLEVIYCGIESTSVKTSIPAEPFTFLLIGNIIPLKGQLTAIKAFKFLNNPKIELKFIGKKTDLEYYDSLLNEIKDYKYKNSIKFLFEIKNSDVLEEIKKSYGLIIASQYEGFSIAFLEAASNSKPVITTKTGIMYDYVKDMENGLIFEYGDYKQLAEKIKLLLENKNLYSSLSGEVTKNLHDFDAKLNFNKYLSIFNQIIN